MASSEMPLKVPLDGAISAAPAASWASTPSASPAVMDGRRRWRVIWTSPKSDIGKNLVTARSFLNSSLSASVTCFRCDSLRMSMKSTTMMPPRSRRRSCLATSRADSMFTASMFSTWLLPRPERPEFTSTTCMASVVSMKR